MSDKLIGVDPASGKDKTIYGFTNWPGGMIIGYPSLSVDLYIDKDWDKFLDKEESDTPIIVEAK